MNRRGWVGAAFPAAEPGTYLRPRLTLWACGHVVGLRPEVFLPVLVLRARHARVGRGGRNGPRLDSGSGVRRKGARRLPATALAPHHLPVRGSSQMAGLDRSGRGTRLGGEREGRQRVPPCRAVEHAGDHAPLERGAHPRNAEALPEGQGGVADAGRVPRRRASSSCARPSPAPAGSTAGWSSAASGGRTSGLRPSCGASRPGRRCFRPYESSGARDGSGC